MYLENEELLVMSNTLEQERDQARGEACILAVRLRNARCMALTNNVDSDLLAHIIAHDPIIEYCDDIIRRYTPQ